VKHAHDIDLISSVLIEDHVGRDYDKAEVTFGMLIRRACIGKLRESLKCRGKSIDHSIRGSKIILSMYSQMASMSASATLERK
jgi:hypothetical protein